MGVTERNVFYLLPLNCILRTMTLLGELTGAGERAVPPRRAGGRFLLNRTSFESFSADCAPLKTKNTQLQMTPNLPTTAATRETTGRRKLCSQKLRVVLPLMFVPLVCLLLKARSYNATAKQNGVRTHV